jgi:bifunctional non-homologous end joining protein LigD
VPSRIAAKAPAAFIVPMKALGVDAIPDHGTWHCEIKWDGYRALAVINHGKVQLWSRNHKPLDYPEVLPPLEALKCRNAVIDGEIVALAPSGHSNFQVLQQREMGERPPIVFYVFDLLHLDGESCLSLPIEARRKRLSSLVGRPKSALRLSPTYDVDPHALFAEIKKKGLEGIIMKEAGSVYEPDRRSGKWLKVKNVNEQEFVIGGFTPPKNSRESFGAILIGYYDKGKLIYAGKVGTGFDVELLRSLHAKFLRLRTATCPFADLPRGNRSRFGLGMTQAVMKTVTWLKPSLVAQIRFTEWTVEGNLRHPVFLGLRKDKSAKDVKREAPAAER